MSVPASGDALPTRPVCKDVTLAIDAREPRGLGVTPDGIQIAAEDRVLRQEVAEDCDGDQDKDRDWHAALAVHHLNEDDDEQRENG